VITERRSLVKESERSTNALAALGQIACGILVVVLFRWTPQTAKGWLIYLGLLAIAIAAAIGFSNKEHKGYWPDKPQDPGSGNENH